MCVLHQDAGLLQLGLEGVPVIRVAMKRFGPDDEVALERAGNAHFGTKLVRCTRFALADAVHLGGVPAVELGLPAPRLGAELCGLFGIGLLESNTSIFGHLHQLVASGFQQATISGVGNRLVLHCGVDDHPGKFLGLDELELNGHVDGLSQQLSQTFFTEQLAELDQGGGVDFPVKWTV